MKDFESKKERILGILLLGIPPFFVLLSICLVFILWEDHNPSPVNKNIEIGAMEILAQEEELEPKRREDILIENMTLEEKAAQLFLVTPESLTGVAEVSAAGETTREAFFQYPVGGMIYFQENLHAEEQVEALLNDMQQISLERLGFPVFLCLGEEAEAAKELKFHLDFSAEETERENELVLIRYFDGYGENGDSALLNIRTEIEEGTDVVLMEHVAVSEDIPASLSGEVINGVVREALGFQGVVITDAMNREEISENYTTAEGAVLALQAGADMILMPKNFQEAYQGVLDAVEDGTLTEERLEESIKRILKLKSKISG